MVKLKTPQKEMVALQLELVSLIGNVVPETLNPKLNLVHDALAAHEMKADLERSRTIAHGLAVQLNEKDADHARAIGVVKVALAVREARMNRVLAMEPERPPIIKHAYSDPEMVSLAKVQSILKGEA